MLGEVNFVVRSVWMLFLYLHVDLCGQFSLFSDFYPYKVHQNVSERRFLIEYKVFTVSIYLKIRLT